MTTIVFDLGVVLAGATSQVADAAARLGVGAQQLEAAYWAHRDAWDRGGTDADYWRSVAGQVGVEVDDDLAGELTARDLATWTTLRPEALAILDELAATGTPVWLLSNAAAGFEEVIDALPWGARLTGRVISGAVGMAKPDEPIYRLVEERTGARGAALAFIDDRPENLVVPRALGWRTHLWRDDADTRAWLVGLGLLA